MQSSTRATYNPSTLANALFVTNGFLDLVEDSLYVLGLRIPVWRMEVSNSLERLLQEALLCEPTWRFRKVV